MKVSVIIHNLNRASVLDACLASVVKQSYRPLEVVLLDAGSVDESERVVERYEKIMEENGIQAKIRRCEPMGVPASRNFASKLASGKLLCAIDNDATFVRPDSFERLVSLFSRDERLAVVTFRVLKGNTEEIDPFAWGFRRPSRRWSAIKFRTFTFTGGAFCVRSNAFWEVGGFWEQLKYSREEEELGLALLDAGWELVYSPDIIIRHHFDPRGRASLASRRYVELKNGALIFWRRLPLPFAMLAIGGRVLTMSSRIALSEKRFPFALIKALAHARLEWKTACLDRQPVSLCAAAKYAVLHFSK